MHNSEVVNIAAAKLSGYTSEAEQIGKSRFKILCMDIGANEDEIAEIERIANSFRYIFQQSNDGVELHREVMQSPYSEIIENGMSAPYTGGEGGLVHMPDGTTHTSLVPPQLWGYEIPDYAKPGTEAFSEMDKLQRTLFPQAVRDAVSASKREYAQLAKEEMIRRFSQVRME